MVADTRCKEYPGNIEAQENCLNMCQGYNVIEDMVSAISDCMGTNFHH